MSTSNFETLVSLYRRLGIVVLEQRQDKSIRLISPKPSWFSLLAKLDEEIGDGCVNSITSNVLNSFIEDDVHHMWVTAQETKVSPIWIEIDATENSMPFEVTALRQVDRMLLIIEYVPNAYEAKQSQAKQARENDLLKSLLEDKKAEQAQKIASRETELEQEINERRALEKQLTHLAFHDALTGLPNRSLFTDRLQRAIAEAERKKESVVVMFIDLDDFKKVNDSFGHHVGDKVIQGAALRLKKCLRDIDSIARLGGDEFTLLVPHMGNHEDIEIIARRLIESLDDPIIVEGTEFRMSISIGVSVFPDDANNEDSLLRNADTAMYFAKHTRGPSYKFYVQDMGTSPSKRLALVSDIEFALQQKEFFLVYQPIIDIHNMEVMGAEALIRWRRSDGEIVEPERFIPLACESDLIIKIGSWVIEQSCNQLRNWRGIYGDKFRMNINLSVRELESKKCKGELQKHMQDMHLPPGSLEVEITDTVPMKESNAMPVDIDFLKSLHISTAIDRFGDRQTSLKSIKALDLNSIKIDRYFLNEIESDQDSHDVFNGIVGLSLSLSKNVLVEGVETQEQLEIIRKMDIKEAQGFFFTQPLESHFFDQWMKEFEMKQKIQLKIVEKKKA
ncbi:MAG: putative bifunctional diguanylate cyclase/phosphodiesterase [Gammaproteobacteria bacterium]